jgi:hypothetical protein
MGGNALKSLGLTPRRLSSDEQEILIERFKKKTQALLWDVQRVLCLQDKTTHGDTDLAALTTPEIAHSARQLLQETLQPKAILKNNNIFSIEFENSQVDLALYTEKTKLQSYLNFCHYSPLGNILGRMLKCTGCIFGIQGLTYPIKKTDEPDSPTLKTLTLSHSMEDVLTLASLNPTTWEKGFACAEDLYSYLSASPLLNTESFIPKNLNHKNRQRMTKRTEFLQWIDYLQKTPAKQPNTKTPCEWRNTLEKKFPHINFTLEKRKALDEDNQRKKQREKFGGRLLLELGVHPTQIGPTLKTLQKTIEEKTPLETWIDTHSPEEIKKTTKKMLLDLHKTSLPPPQ